MRADKPSTCLWKLARCLLMKTPTSMYTETPVQLRSSSPSQRARNRIGRRIAIGFGLVSVVAVIMCGMLFSVILRTSKLVECMRGDERAIDQSHMLATAVREQYAHQAHTIIEANRTHLDHYQEWVERVARTAADLRPIVPVAEVNRLDDVLAQSQQLDATFREAIVPAVERGDHAAVAHLHLSADRVAAHAAKQADAIARAVEARMVEAHVSAMRATHLGLIGGAACVTLVLALAFGYTLQLRKAVLKPLAVLAESARRLGEGDYSVRVGECGEGELHDLGEAFDRMVQEIEAREQRMMQAERMAVVGQLAAGVAHEINNPIGIIRGYLKTMTPDSAPDVLLEEIRILDEEAAACQRIAEDLLVYATGSEVRLAPTPMRAFLTEAVRRFQDSHAGTTCRFVVNAQSGTVEVDAGRVRQVLFNLLRNAVRASPVGAPIEIVGTSLADAGYEFSVCDRGRGIDPADRSAVFEPFFSKTAGGSGLGLAVCDSIVQAHGGTIGVEEGPGGGALFRVHFPVRQGPDRKAI
ncbi:MAG: hypothetical protein RL701_6073 [Pseudomonadota bacterium]